MSVGFWQIVLVLLIVVIFFGVGKLPRVMGDLGKGVRAFKEGLSAKDGTTKPDDGTSQPPQITAQKDQEKV